MALAPAASGNVAVVPGKIDDSELYQRIASKDPEERMPPPKSGKSLSAAEVSRLKTWIEQGGDYQRHWAFVPPTRPSLPSVKNPGWCRDPIDFFILGPARARRIASFARGGQGDSDPPA